MNYFKIVFVIVMRLQIYKKNDNSIIYRYFFAIYEL
jgi:hypothetical protein